MSEPHIISRPANQAYRDNWDRLWGKRPEPHPFIRLGMRIECNPDTPRDEVWMVDSQGKRHVFKVIFSEDQRAQLR